MAAIKIQSENPQLSYVLRKNPATGLVGKTNRASSCLGYYVDPQTYIVVNLLKPNSVCFSPQKEFTYLDCSVESGGICYATNISTLLKDALKVPTEEDVLNHYTTTVTLVCLYIPQHIAQYCSKQFPEYNLIPIHESSSLYKVVVQSSVSIKHTLELAYLISALAIPPKSEFISDSFIESLVNILKNVPKSDPKKTKKSFLHKIGFKRIRKTTQPATRKYPYQMLNLINRQLISNSALFRQYKKDLESLCDSECQLVNCSLFDSRFQFVSSSINHLLPLVDIGCGEGRYIRLYKNLERVFLVERNEELHRRLNFISNKRSCEQVENAVSSVSELSIEDDLPVQVLLTEVLEHNSLEEAQALLEETLSLLNVNRMIITVPNKEFNKYYGIPEDQFRDEDHQWEMNQEDFKDWINSLECLEGAQFTFSQIGDTVEGISPTTGLIVEF